MKIGINTYPFLWTCEITEAFNRISEMGMKDVEILSSPPFLWPRGLGREDRSKMLQAAKNAGIRMQALNPPGLDINLASPNPDMREYTVDQYKQLITLAKEWEIPYIVMPPGKLHPLLPPDFEWVWKQCKSSFEELVEFAGKNEVVLLIENIPSLFLQTSEEISWAVNELKSKHFQVVYDVANAYMVENPAEGIRKLGDSIKLVHLSDTKRSKWEHAVIGSGEVDFESVYVALRDIQYDATCMLEIIHPEAESGIQTSIENLLSRGWNVDV